MTPLPFHKQHKVILTALGIPAAIILISGISLGIYTMDKGVFVKGITISDTDISNLTKSEAHERLDLESKTILERTKQKSSFLTF